MTSYTITVNGKSYDVTVQKKKDISSTPVGVPQAVVTGIIPVAAEPGVLVGGSIPTATVAGGEGKVVAPMPGKIMEIQVRVGDHVKKGQQLLIMEAMKMHNPILAAHEGVISKLFVKVNDPVQSGQLLLAIR